MAATTTTTTRAGLGYITPPTTTTTTTCILKSADSGSPESHRYFLARRTAFQMLRDRGCNVDDSEVTRTIEEFRTVFGDQPDPEQLRICAHLAAKPSKKILVIFGGPLEINKAKAVGILVNVLNKESLQRIIIVLEGKMNHFARKVFDECQVKVELFPITELFVNITTHVTMPKHEILTNEEKERVILKHKIADTQIPRMLESDAIARYYGLEKKQVVKLTYNSRITGSFVTYRCVT